MTTEEFFLKKTYTNRGPLGYFCMTQLKPWKCLASTKIQLSPVQLQVYFLTEVFDIHADAWQHLS